MKKSLIWFFSTIGGLALGLAFYLGYIHLISWLAYPMGIAVFLFVSVIAIAAVINFLSGLKYFIVSIFKDDKTLDHKGFKKNF